jgi:hypothetical protein
MTTSSTEEIKKFQAISAKNRKQGGDHEEFLERRLGLTMQRGSGCGPVEKEDLVGKDPRGQDIMVQAKSYSGKTVTIKIDDIERLVRHAAECKVFEDRTYVSDGREPVFVVRIVREMFVGPTDWVMVPLEEWEKYE